MILAKRKYYFDENSIEVKAETVESMEYNSKYTNLSDKIDKWGTIIVLISIVPLIIFCATMETLFNCNVALLGIIIFSTLCLLAVWVGFMYFRKGNKEEEKVKKNFFKDFDSNREQAENDFANWKKEHELVVIFQKAHPNLTLKESKTFLEKGLDKIDTGE